MKELTKNIRFYILLISFTFSLVVFIFIKSTIPSGTIQTIKLTQIYALTAVFFLYITLLATPLTKYFHFLPFRGEYIKARRALGISVFYFGLLHGYLAFFKQLGGFVGLGFLSDKYILAIILSFTALLIFTLMALTAFDSAIEKLGFAKWKTLHRFIYLAGILVLIHAMMLGTHFVNLSTIIPKIFFVALTILLVLEAKRLDEFLFSKNLNLPFGLVSLVAFGGSIYFLLTYVFSGAGSQSLGIHSQHIAQANKDVVSGIKLDVSMSPFQNFVKGKKSNLQFRVFNMQNGDILKEFSINQEKIMHLIVVNENLDFFDHVHPEYKDGVFSIDYTFPKDGFYRIYVDFQPNGMSEQYHSFRVNVGGVTEIKPNVNIDFKDNSKFEGINSNLVLPKNLNSKDLSVGKNVIGVKLSDSNGNEIKNIEPYLGAFGHVVMINTNTYEYVHIHPKQSYAPYEGQMTGPLVEFSPLGIYGNIKSGNYKLFAQFRIDGKMYVFPYFIKVN